MMDVELRLRHQPGELARMGTALGVAGVSVEGGGVFLAGGVGIAHFLVADGPAARAALEAEGLEVVSCREVVTVRLRQDRAGQLGSLTGALARAGVNIETQYSDHDHRLVLLVDRPHDAERVCAEWTAANDAG